LSLCDFVIHLVRCHDLPSSTSFVSADGDPLALYSFPTRRSSDLHPPEGDRRSRQIRRLQRPYRDCDARRWTGSCTDACRHPARRSEEHTSELQSRENLVCRLLLEKKKKRKVNPLHVCSH